MKKNIRKAEGKANATAMNAAQLEKVEELKRKVFENKEAGNYDDALLAVIELFEMNYVEVELLYETADLYYLSGDYERAAVWGEKTLSFEPNHMQVLLLLANVYAIEDKVKKGLGTLQRILEVSAGVLTEEAKESVDEILDYFDSDYDAETLEEKYPLVWRYLQENLETPEEVAAMDSLVEADVLNEMEEEATFEIEASEETEREDASDAQVALEMEEPCRELEKADEAPQGEAEIAAAEAEAAASAEDFSDEPQQSASLQGSVFSAREEEELLALSPAEISEFIMGKEISLTEKLGLCNYFAAFYDERKCQEHVLALLQQALRIDATDDLSRKNLGYALLSQNDRAGALQCFESLRRKDLMVLAQIRRMQN